jgi:hypothetical protein
MMKLVRRLALGLPLAAAAPALAQPAPSDGPTVVVVSPQPVVVTGASPVAPGAAEMPPIPAAASPAPQNEQWSNVSHINGQVVPVGERNNYLYKWKKTNIASNPIGWIAGIYGLSVSQALSDNAAIRADANLFSDMFDGHNSGYEVGVTVPLYFRRVYSGPFIEGGALVRRLTENDEWDGSTSSHASWGPQVMFGWHWTFDSGLNVAFAGGAMRDMSDDAGSSMEPVGYFRVGYAY